MLLVALLGAGCATTHPIHVFTRPDGVASVQPIVDALRHEGLEVEERVIRMPKGLAKTALFADDGYQDELCITHLGELIAAAFGRPFGGKPVGWAGRGDYPKEDIALYWLERGSAKQLAADTGTLSALAKQFSLDELCH